MAFTFGAFLSLNWLIYIFYSSINAENRIDDGWMQTILCHNLVFCRYLHFLVLVVRFAVPSLCPGCFRLLRCAPIPGGRSLHQKPWNKKSVPHTNVNFKQIIYMMVLFNQYQYDCHRPMNNKELLYGRGWSVPCNNNKILRAKKMSISFFFVFLFGKFFNLWATCCSQFGMPAFVVKQKHLRLLWMTRAVWCRLCSKWL